MPSKPLVVYLLDQSGSMEPFFTGYSELLRQHLDKLAQTQDRVNHHCIVFSGDAHGGPRFASLPVLGMNTNIENGLRSFLLHLEKSSPDDVILVFISDGQDDEPRSILERISQLRRPPIRRFNMLTVAVGKEDFPTGMAIRLLDHFQTDMTDEADCRPFVVEMSRTSDGAVRAVAEVGRFIQDVLCPPKVNPFACLSVFPLLIMPAR